MHLVDVTIVRFADAHQPGWIECELTDAHGRRHSFLEKIPVVTPEYLDAESIYPRKGEIACEVVSTGIDSEGRAVATIDTSRPCGIESKEGASEFVVLADALRKAEG
jgi:hypothetical protein